MRALKGTDPRSIGGYRLLARLGAGGMGVVYLARSPGGALVALKVIRAEYAADPAFRSRFRREADSARLLRGRFVVPVTAADPDAREPWLATAFVPGPSLAEALAERGPFPYRSVRGLGARLALALAEVHAVGLVHRDVKPGNVLLALDGPRLIDFGIARSLGATALTAPDAVIGTPGYLAPEQARMGTGEVGPPSDVFALGCVLAHATTGRRPFGTGAALAVLVRAVQEPADLTGVGGPWRALLERCLSKDPAGRPTAAALAAELGPVPPVAGAPGDDDWLPPDLPALIAERSARVLDLPEPEPEPQHPAAPPPVAPPPPGRRRFLSLGAAAGVLAAGGATAAYLAHDRDDTGGDAGRRGTPPLLTLGLHGDTSGPDRAVGRAQHHGARLAVAAHNARPDRAVTLRLVPRDDGGDPDRSRAVARRFVDDPAVYAVLGPTSDATALAASELYVKAGLPMLTVWAGHADLQKLPDTPVFTLRPYTTALAAPVVQWLTHVRPARRTALIDDREDEDHSYVLVKALREIPPSRGTASVHTVEADSDDFGPAVADALAAGAQGVVYCGTSPRRAALCARALRSAGFTGGRALTQPAGTGEFLTAAGDAAEGWAIGSTFVDPERLPRAAGFVRAYREEHGTGALPPGTAEAYDAVGLVARGLDALDTPDRVALRRHLRGDPYRGITRRYRFVEGEDTVVQNDGMFLWLVRDGRARYLGPFLEVDRKAADRAR
ncbi:bifunctional serine/threonine-protein kinase/ABC transporter substrate-binding protein [Streptomyces sp. NPDC059578]|uniref:bifunctional serine/threonine-protein kinase/ABC transporter substrate-binding protein n=1 Tax=Streptomyces sp. NPDC059578 TaxID=3346874 RepID=UPI003683EB55